MKMVMSMLVPLLTAAMTLPAAGASVAGCSNDVMTARAGSIAEPWEKNTRTFSRGEVRVAVMDTIEPACCSWHLLVLSPSGGGSGEGDRACNIVSDQDQTGFSGIDFVKLTSSYDARKGLLLTFPVKVYDQKKSDGSSRLGVVKVRINSATGQVSVEK